MTEQTGTGNSIPGEASSLEPASCTTVSDASLDKFARTFEASAKRWEIIVYPSLLMFIVLAAYGFYLIYSMTHDVHRVTGQMDTIVHSMVVLSDNMVHVTDNMTSMAVNMNTMTTEVAHMGRNFDEGIDIATRMDQKFEVMLPIAHRMQIDADVMTHRMQNVTRPMNYMSRMFPMNDWQNAGGLAMTTIIIVIQNAPYKKNHKAWHALRFAGAALAEDMNVRVHLLDDGVEVGRRGHQVPEGAVNLEELLGELIECGLEVSACGMALNDCAIDESAMLPGIECGSMKALAGWVKTSDNVMTF